MAPFSIPHTSFKKPEAYPGIKPQGWPIGLQTNYTANFICYSALSLRWPSCLLLVVYVCFLIAKQ